MSRRHAAAVAQVLVLTFALPAHGAVRIALVGDQGDDAPPNPIPCFGAERQPLGCLGEALSRIQAGGVAEARPFDALVFLGDNFYPRGLNESHWQEKRDAVLRHFEGLLPADRVHAVPGNHDYYQFFLGQPFGFTTIGNAREKEIPRWTYHYWWPEEAVYEVGPGARLQVVFLDSARIVGLGPRYSGESLQALTTLLRARADDPTVRWRFVAMHHPLRAVGHHGNYGRSCESWPWIERHLPPLAIQDTCSTRYRDYVESVREAIEASGVRVQLALSGHDHSLQILDRPSTREIVQVISGAATETKLVAPADPARGTFTSAATGSNPPASRPRSEFGFAEVEVGETAAVVRFRSSRDGMPVPLGGVCEFSVDLEGALHTTPCGTGAASTADPRPGR
jgi:hypothetical protein